MLPPYQTADEETRRQAGTPIKTATTIATSSIAGGAAFKKIMPFLNKLIPGELMRKGLSKVNPDIGKFINTALNNGYGLEDIRNFMSEKFIEKKPEVSQQKQEQQENPIIKQSKDFETNYPDITQALMGYINKGQTPQAAAAILKQSTPFIQKIKKIEKDTGKNFVDFVIEMMGNQGNASNQSNQVQQQTTQEQPPQPPPQQQQTSSSSQSPQSPQGSDPQLSQLMQGIRSTIQRLRGQNNKTQDNQGLPVYYDYDRG